MEFGRIIPPKTAYGCRVEPGVRDIVYVRGLAEPLEISVAIAADVWRGRQFNPRSGEVIDWHAEARSNRILYRPPDLQVGVPRIEAVSP
jgi:hypothetical protein